MRKYVRISLCRLMALSNESFVKYRGEGKIMPLGTGNWYMVRKGSRALREIREQCLRHMNARLVHLAVQRRKKQARARTGRRS